MRITASDGMSHSTYITRGHRAVSGPRDAPTSTWLAMMRTA